MQVSPAIDMTQARPQRVILTGGPGAGKTTLLRALAELGYATVDESARAIIAERRAAGASPRPEPARFAAEILRRDIDKYKAAPARAGPVFFDRGVIEALGAVQECAPLPPPELDRMLARYPYARPVLVLPPWPAIYRTDAERDQSFEQSVDVYQRIVAWYAHCGYPVHEVPCLPVRERARHVLRVLGCFEP